MRHMLLFAKKSANGFLPKSNQMWANGTRHEKSQRKYTNKWELEDIWLD